MPNLQVAAVAAAAVLAWLVLLQVAVWVTRPAPVEPGPESLDLGPEPPAVANLLTGGWRLSQDATAATLLDLAARDVLGLEQQGPDPERTICRIRDASPPGLTGYERRVLNRVVSLAEGGVVPAAALVRGNESWARTWWRGFRKEVIADARRRGLSRDRWSKPVLASLHTAALAPALLATATALTGHVTGDDGKQEPPLALALAAGIVVWSTLAATVRWFTDQRDTEAGRAAAARWLGYRDHVSRDEAFETLPPAAVAIWDRHLAYAAALGIAKTAVRVLPLGARSDTRAWSSYGGSWHQIRIRYPTGLWGASPWRVGLRGLLQTGFGGVVSYFVLPLRLDFGAELDSVRPGLDRWSWSINVLLVVAAAVLAFGLRNLFRALAEYPSRRPVDAEVVRLVTKAVGDSEHRSYLHYAGVDDGRSPKTRAYRLSGEQYQKLDEGDEVRLVVGRWLGRVFEVAVTREQAPPPDTEAVPSVPADYRPERPGNLLGRVTGAALGALATGAGAVPGSAAAAYLDPVRLVPPDDVATALGVPVLVQPVGESGRIPVLGTRMCTYAPQRGDHPKLLVQVAAGGLAMRLAGLARTRGEPVPGVPDAYFFDSGSRQQGVVLLRGTTTVAIGSHGPNADRVLLARLAAAAAARLAALPAVTT